MRAGVTNRNTWRLSVEGKRPPERNEDKLQDVFVADLLALIHKAITLFIFFLPTLSRKRASGKVECDAKYTTDGQVGMREIRTTTSFSFKGRAQSRISSLMWGFKPSPG